MGGPCYLKGTRSATADYYGLQIPTGGPWKTKGSPTVQGAFSIICSAAAFQPAPHVVTAAGATQVPTLDLGARETVWDVTMAAYTAFIIDNTNMAIGSSLNLILRQDSTAGQGSFPLARWPNGSVPTLNHSLWKARPALLALRKASR